MTDYIVEDVKKGTYCEYVDDGKNQVILVTPHASVLKREYKEPKELRQLLRMLPTFRT